MQRLEVSGAVQPIYVSLDVKRLNERKKVFYCIYSQLLPAFPVCGFPGSFISLKISNNFFSPRPSFIRELFCLLIAANISQCTAHRMSNFSSHTCRRVVKIVPTFSVSLHHKCRCIQIDFRQVLTQVTQALRVSRNIALLFSRTFGTRLEVSAPRPGRLFPWERPGAQFTEGWVCPRAGLDGRKISSPPGFDPEPSTSQSVAIPTELP